MVTYIFRNSHDKAIRGCIVAKNEKELFDLIDHNENPFAFEFIKTDDKIFWIPDHATWSVFKPMKNFYENPTLIKL